jgi:putative PIN family toxin of toxin-antitoxin system
VTSAADQVVPQGPARAPARSAVIDTNVWLDIHHFRDPQSEPLAAALQSPHWMAARCEQTDAELALVLQRPRFSSDPAERLRLLECLRSWQARTVLLSLGASAPTRCRDPHDQKFLDLAHAARACVLLTKDKALLALKRSALRHGLMIVTPRQFADELLPFDERLRPVERPVPLVRDPIQVSPGFGQAPGLQLP